MTEEQLISECIEGNYRAQKKLYTLFSGKMMGISMRYASCVPEAEDIRQESFIKVFNKIDTFQATGPLGGWIRRIVVNTALQRIRDNKNYRMHVEIDASESMLEVSDGVLAQMGAAEIMRKVQKLPNGFRTVFNLYAIEGYTHPEISKELGISVGTSKSQYSRARAILRTLIEKEENISEKAV